MAEQNRFLTSVTMNMNEGVLGVDRSGRVVFVNARARSMFNLEDAELISQDVAGLIDLSLTETGSSLRDAWGDGRAIHDHNARIRLTGSAIPVSLDAWPQMKDGVADGAVCILRDVSVEHRARERRTRELDAMVSLGRTKDALDEERLVLYGQPIFDLGTGEIVSHKLLVRILDRSGRLIPPAEFLPAAEQYGLIQEIDTWVISQGIRTAATCGSVEINLSAHTLNDLAILHHIEAELAACRVNPTLITFEVTETAVLSNAETAARFVRALRERGCGVSLDDFGTGFGGFTYLKQLPATRLKIDRQFVQNLDQDHANQHVVKAIVSLARGFGQTIVGEGIEEPGDFALLHEYGVDYAQGYLLGRPMPVAEISSGRRAINQVIAQRAG